MVNFKEKMASLDLFSGIGGITIALEDWCEPAAYCEIEKFPQQVLLSRMSEGQLPAAPIFTDVTKLKGKMLPKIDIICGGFPCQDISSAGLGKGMAGERSSLFYQIMRLAGELSPRFIFLENVAAIKSRGLPEVGSVLSKAGYDCRWLMVKASELGAKHSRERWFCLAHPNKDGRADSPSDSLYAEKSSNEVVNRRSGSFQEVSQKTLKVGNKKQKKPYTGKINSSEHNGKSYKQTSTKIRTEGLHRFTQEEWQTKCPFRRVAYGLPNTLDRIGALGNSVVPLQVKEAFEILAGLKNPYPTDDLIAELPILF